MIRTNNNRAPFYKRWRSGINLLLILFTPFLSFAAGVHITGQVTDATNGQGLPNVSIQVKGSHTGMQTDVTGHFAMNVPDNATLVFTFIGYETLEVPVAGRTVVNIQLKPSTKNLADVVVIGYGTQKRTSLTASVSTLNTAEIANKPVVNLTNGVVGRASGLIATQGSGEPGFDGANILVRGVGSIGSTAPLLIVDGVPRDFSRLDPNSVATFTVLKDAAAVAPYGVAGANGVIVVTTKTGKSGKPTLTYNGYYGVQNPTRFPKFVNSYQYALLRNEANANDGQPAAYSADDIQKFKDHSDPDGHPDGHPLRDIIKPNRPITYHNLSMTGGNEDYQYFASIGYQHQDGMWSTTYLDKYMANLSLTAHVTKTTKVGFSANGYVEDQHFPATGAGSIIDQAMRQAPTTPVYYSNGLWTGYIGQSLIGEIYHSGYHLNENNALLTQLSIEQQLPVKGLSVKGVVSYDNGPDPIFGNKTSFQREYHTPIPFWNVDTTKHPYEYVKGTQGNSKAQFYEDYAQNKALTYQGMLNYSGHFGKSDITGLAVVENRVVKYQTFHAQRINYNLDIDELNFGGPAASDATNSGLSSGQRQLGYVYRVGYSYDNRYMLEAAGRYDGSYLFAPGNRFGFFPAFSAGWRVSEEAFMKNITWIDNLKIRGSWGQSGAYPSSGGTIQTYQYLSPYNAYGNSAVIGGDATQGVYEALQGNPNITWERAKKTDVGFEAGLWKGLLGIEADYFFEKRSNMLVGIGNALPAEYGLGVGLINAGIMQNQGVDLTLTSSRTFDNGMQLDVKGTFTYAKNKLLKVYENDATFKNPNRRQTGRPNGTQFGLDAIGYFQQDDFNGDGTLKAGIPVPTFGDVKAGDIRYADLSGPGGKPDGRIDANDITRIGYSTTPEIIYGLEPRLSYKGFDLDALFQGSGHSSLYVNQYFVWPFQSSGSATELAFNDHWTPTHTDALYPRITGTPTTNNTQQSSWWMRNTSYLRLRSAELGYNFSARTLGHSIHGLRVYVSGQNLFTWTPKIKETFDPENNSSSENYFQQRIITFGINATF